MINISVNRLGWYIALSAFFGAFWVWGVGQLIDGNVISLAFLGLALIAAVAIVVGARRDTRVTGDASPSGADTDGAPGA